MKILFVISNTGEGRGGHYHSLNHISRELAKFHECKIVTIGSGSSPVIFNNPLFLLNVKVTGIKYIHFLKQFKEIIRDESPDIIHFFDVFSYNILRFVLKPKKQNICITKCGGPNPRWFPIVNNIVLFSFENYNWFKNKKKYRNSNISLIPNRVSGLEFNQNYRPIQRKREDFIFVRICRIGKMYQKSIEDSIRLVDYLRYKGYHHVRLFIIGNIQNHDLYNQLTVNTRNKDNYIHIITSPDLTQEASRMLYLADAVLGTGRGIMEAASLKIPLLAFNSEDNLPTLIDSSTFNNLFKTNFSERGSLKRFDKHENIIKIEKMIDDGEYYNELALFSEKIFNKHFSIRAIYSLYNSFYINSVQSSKKSLLDILHALRHVILFLRYSKK